eukprot:764025-Hanusia_phi.AAC.1
MKVSFNNTLLFVLALVAILPSVYSFGFAPLASGMVQGRKASFCRVRMSTETEAPPAAEKKAAKPAKMGKQSAFGPFTPLVVATRAVVGEKRFNQIRGKVHIRNSDLSKLVIVVVAFDHVSQGSRWSDNWGVGCYHVVIPMPRWFRLTSTKQKEVIGIE